MPPSSQKPERYDKLLKSLDQVKAGTELVGGRKAQATPGMNRLQSDVLFEYASALVMMLNRAADPKVYNNFKPIIIIVEEAGMLGEIDTVPLFSLYPLQAPTEIWAVKLMSGLRW